MEPKHAIWAWFNGQHVWNPEHERYEGQAGDIGIHWYGIDFEQAVVMISSCFRRLDGQEERW